MAMRRQRGAAGRGARAAGAARSGSTAPASGGSAWFYGRPADLLLGAGLGYLLSVPLLVAVR